MYNDYFTFYNRHKLQNKMEKYFIFILDAQFDTS